MTEQATSTMAPATPGEKPSYRLRVRRDSWAIPLMFLLAAIAGFVIYALPLGERQFIENLYDFVGVQDRADLNKDTLTEADLVNAIKKATKALDEKGKEGRDALLKKAWAHPFATAGSLGLPVVKIYFQKLAEDFIKIVRGSAQIALTFALCALIPGLAGLIYRRRFWHWFLISLAVLVGINQTGVMGTLAISTTIPKSGELLFFVLSQVVLIILALRMRRHSTGGGLLPLWLHNWGLALILTLVGVACVMGWGNQYQIWSFLGTGLLGFIYQAEFILIVLPLLYMLLRDSPVWPARRGKNIVICLDGTTNTPDQMERGFAAQTNVFKLFKMLKSNTEGGFLPENYFDASLFKKYGDKQVAFYYAGVGNTYDNDPIMQTLGGATGLGANGIIERAYLDLVRVYRPHDRVYIVGFSRGAAIARLLARTIDARKAPSWIYTIYLLGRHRVLARSREPNPVKIDVLACFDTVGSFGVAKTIGGINFQQINMGLDMTVPDNVERAYHMVALDEQRDSFEPTLMEPDPIYPESIVEVWFAGDHANIGGGWATDNLSDITLDFLLRHVSSGYLKHDNTSAPPAISTEMADAPEIGEETWGIYLEAEKKAKAFGDVDPKAVDPQSRGQVRHWFSNLYEYRPRKLPPHAVIHDSVFDRITLAKPVYAPQALFDLLDALAVKRSTITKEATAMAGIKLLSEAQASSIIESGKGLRLWRWSEYEKEKLTEYLPKTELNNADLDVPESARSALERAFTRSMKPRAEAAV